MGARFSSVTSGRRCGLPWQLVVAVLAVSFNSPLAQAQGPSGQNQNNAGSIRRVVEPAGVQIVSSSTRAAPCAVRRGDKVSIVGGPAAGDASAPSAAFDIRVLSGACAGTVGRASMLALSPST